MSYSVIRHSNFEGVGITLLHPRARDLPAAMEVGGLRRADDSPPRELAEHEEAGQRRTVAANRRRPRPPINPRVCAPRPGPVGSLRRPRFGYRAQGRRPITSLATAVGITSSPLLSTLALFSHPFDPSHHRQKSTTPNFQLEFPSFLFNPSSSKRLILIDLSSCHPHFTYLFFLFIQFHKDRV